MAQGDHIIGLDMLSLFRNSASIHYDYLFNERQGIELNVEFDHRPIHRFSQDSNLVVTERFKFKSRKIAVRIGYKKYGRQLFEKGRGTTNTWGLGYLHATFIDEAYLRYLNVDSDTKLVGPESLLGFYRFSYMWQVIDRLWIEPTVRLDLQYYLQGMAGNFETTVGLNAKVQF